MGGGLWRTLAIVAVAIILFVVLVILWKAVTFAVLGGLALLVASIVVGRWGRRG